MGRVLVIDDNEGFRFYVATLLRRAGYEVADLGDGSAVVDVVAQGRFDVVVVDVYMPAFDGIEILLALRRAGVDVAVVGMSGKSSGPDDPIARAMCALGAEAVLAKPFLPVELLAVIGRTIERGGAAGK